MTAPRILLFDSGMGGLTVARAVAQQMQDAHLVYAADAAGFPYGAWDEAALVRRILKVISTLNDLVQPDVIVIACNTASTIALAELRATFPTPFVGTVPAIKPAAAQTKTGIIGVLATPGTVKREYTQSLINSFASNCKVTLHGAPKLAQIAERHLRGANIDRDELRAEIAPAFAPGTDVIVLGCTHYPLIADEIAAAAPWEVTYIDPSAAIARRAGDVSDEARRNPVPPDCPEHGTVILTSATAADDETRAAYSNLGFPYLKVVNLPV
jgi:glutamate racemase